MDRLLVTGGTPLDGTVEIAGAKNSALKLMAAVVLSDGRSTLRNVPRIQDCITMVEVLEHLGVGCGWNIGSRAIDLHIRGLEKMGARFSSEHGFLLAETSGLRGAVVNLDFPSVGATENVLMAAVAARGTTVIENAAREPELVDLADFLRGMGARIDGAGTPTIEIQGVEAFAPVDHAVIPDRVEAGPYAIAVCSTGGRLVLSGARGDHMDLVLSKLADGGADV